MRCYCYLHTSVLWLLPRMFACLFCSHLSLVRCCLGYVSVPQSPLFLLLAINRIDHSACWCSSSHQALLDSRYSTSTPFLIVELLGHLSFRSWTFVAGTLFLLLSQCFPYKWRQSGFPLFVRTVLMHIRFMFLPLRHIYRLSSSPSRSFGGTLVQLGVCSDVTVLPRLPLNYGIQSALPATIVRSPAPGLRGVFISFALCLPAPIFSALFRRLSSAGVAASIIIAPLCCFTSPSNFVLVAPSFYFCDLRLPFFFALRMLNVCSRIQHC